MKTKIIAMYLPQYHSIPENDEFWGKGFTDWVTVKKAKPLFDGHIQPRVPLNDNYYDLSLKENVKWQAELAKEYGIYGFGVYHYWFNNDKNLLTKPAEIMRDNDDIPINYFLAWDNANWKRSWSNVYGNAWAPIMEKDKNSNQGPEILIPYILGTETDWENHYNYLLTHFKSPNYIKQDGKPIFVILQHDEKIKNMCDYWDMLAKRDGFNGIHFIFKMKKRSNFTSSDNLFLYEPIHHGWAYKSLFDRVVSKLFNLIRYHNNVRQYNYDIIWKTIIRNAKKSNSNVILGAFVNYDDTPRRGERGIIVSGSSPQKFKKYLEELIKISNSSNKDYIFLTAWNEWGEGAFLEPDTVNHYAYLKVIKEAIESVN